MEHLARDWPEMVPLYEKLYQGRAYLPEALVKPSRDRARELAHAYDVRDRRAARARPLVLPAADTPGAVEQLALIVATEVQSRAA